MKNLLSRTVWDYLLGAVVGGAMALVSLVISGFFLGVVLRASPARLFAGGRLVLVAILTFLAVLIVVTLYEALLRYRAQGKMLEPGSTEARVLSREVLVRAAISGAVAGLYTGLIVVLFGRLAWGTADLNLLGVFSFGLLPGIFVIAAGALTYAYIGNAVEAQQNELEDWERVFLLALPLTLTVTLGFLFGAAAGNWLGILSAFIAALLTYGLITGFRKLRWYVLRRSLEGLLRARGGPTIKLVSTHRA